MKRVEDKIYYSFSLKQQRFANIVGSDYFGRPFSEVADSITTSRYNPTVLSPSDDGLKERLEALNTAINALKSKVYVSK